MSEPPPCGICRSATVAAGVKQSQFSRRSFALATCSNCGYSFVVDPRTDFANLYDAQYYGGAGADPDVNYNLSLADRRATQRYEWQGVLDIVGSLTAVSPETRWLDFGCGLGGLVRFARARGVDIVGHDEGYGADRMRLDGLPLLERSQFDSHHDTFDVITAIEVLEHTVDPLSTLRVIAALLKPGGLFFLTTGNAEPYRGRLAGWRYVNPDVHVSFFEPRTLDRAMQEVGLIPEYPGYTSGFTSLIRAKILRTIGVKRSRLFEYLLPWAALGRLADRHYKVSAQPAGRKEPFLGPPLCG